MRTYRLYCPQLSEGVNTLSPEESHHAQASLRIRTGDPVTLFDGKGCEGTGRIGQTSARLIEVVVEGISDPRPFDARLRLTLVVAMPKSHRQGFLIEKCTELGVATIVPIITERSVSRPANHMVEKWRRKAIEACKQSGRCWLPTVSRPIAFRESLDRLSEFDATGFTDRAPTGNATASLFSALPADASCIIWVGPEGGWTPEEQRHAMSAGATIVSLGSNTLRTETAAIAVCAQACLSSSDSSMVADS